VSQLSDTRPPLLSGGLSGKKKKGNPPILPHKGGIKIEREIAKKKK